MTEVLTSTPVQVAAIVVALALMYLFGRARATDAAPRIDAEAVYGRLSGDVRAEVDALLRSGKKIEAIRRVRVASGLGLKDSKDVVEARARLL